MADEAAYRQAIEDGEVRLTTTFEEWLDQQEAGELDLSAHYRVAGYEGVAFYLRGYKMERDEDYDWTGIETEDRQWVRAVMVGDDREHLVDVDDLELLDEDKFCHGCGQIGCGC